MGAKEIVIKPISAKDGNRICKKYHYSGKVVPNSQLHLGVFYKGICEGVMQFGPSTNKPAMVKNLKIGFNEFIELNRMAFSDELPRFSESRAISIAIKIIKKNYPFIRLVVSYADACQCGDGAIYRASGFKLHSFKKNNGLLKISKEVAEKLRPYINLKEGVVSDKSLNNIVVSSKTLDHKTNEVGKRLTGIAKKLGATPIKGYQMKYLYCIDKSLENKYNWIPFSSIPDEVKMYKGKSIKRI